ncbi:MAG: M23 family metallopeptidase [Pseudomonadota bacterium]
MPLAVLITLFLSLVLSGCASHNHSQKLLSNIETSLKKTHKIKHGAVVARYNLAHTSRDKCLYFKGYGPAINDDINNRAYIQQITSQISSNASSHFGAVQLLQHRAKAKISELRKILSKLNDKYTIYSSTETKKLAHERHQIKANSPFDLVDKQGAPDVAYHGKDYIEALYQIDDLAKHVPIFFPETNSRLTSGFGMRLHPCTKTKKFHYGTDFAGPLATNVYAAAEGVVIAVSHETGYGLIVTIVHGKHFKTRYAHLKKAFVATGTKVIQGQKIGLQGSSGKVTNEHLHFEVLVNGNHANPMDFVAPAYHCQNKL